MQAAGQDPCEPLNLMLNSFFQLHSDHSFMILPSFFHSLIHSLTQQYLLSTYCVPSTVLDAGNPAVNKRDSSPCPHGTDTPVGETDKKKINK